MITLLQKHIPNVKEDMKLHIKQLKEKEYYLLFAGKWQTAQKNINLILTFNYDPSMIQHNDNCGDKTGPNFP